jgi:ankyrin repeat protein
MSDLDIKRKIYQAINEGNLSEVKALIGDDRHLRDLTTKFGTWLHRAAVTGNLPIVKWLVEKAGMDINQRAGMYDGNALNEAVSEGHLDVVRYLAGRGAAMDVSSPERNPLFGAVLERNLEIAKFLLAQGIDPTINYPGPKFKTHSAYSFALEWGCHDIADYLQKWIRDHPKPG